MDTVRIGQIWDSCPRIETCSLPAICCANCLKYQRIASIEMAANRAKEAIRNEPIKAEVVYGYDEYRPCDT